MKRKFISILINQCVLALVLWQPVIHAENVQVTNVDIPVDKPVQTHVEHTVSPAQITETVNTDQHTNTVILATSLTTSLSIDQSESSSIKDGTHSSTLVEPSFSEVQRTSQTEQALVESESQSTSTDQSEVTSKSPSSEIVTENKNGLGDSAPVTAPEEHFSSEKEDDIEDKVTEKVEDIKTDAASKEIKSSVNITESDTPEKVREEEKEEVVTEPSVELYKEEAREDGEQHLEVGGKPGVDGETSDVIREEKPEEEGLTFNEWTQKVLAEAERGKQGGHEDIQNFQLPPVKQRKKKNYASHECGAKILASNPEASSPKSVLNSNRDEYMNNPCKAKKWFVIELCEPIQAHSVDIASLELFSSAPKKFRVFLSDRYPTKDWKVAGEFDLRDERTVQTLPITDAQDYYAKFVRVELYEHFGDEHFCPLTIFRVLGIAVIDYEDDHHENIDDDNDDENDENHEGETEEGSKNLFTSAKDTVINIVKKVLNVESEGERLIQNASQVNVPVNTNGTSVNVSASTEPEPTLPCVPDANIVTDKEDSCTSKKDEGHMDDILPHPVEPGKTDSVLVVKLEDHEQVETTPDISQRKSLDAHIQDCFLTVLTMSELKKRLSIVHSNFCEFLYMVKQQSPVQGYYESSVKKKKVAGKIVGGGDGRIKASDQVPDTTVAVDKTLITQTDTVSKEVDTDSKTFTSSDTKVLQDNHISESKILSEFSSGQEKSKSETADISKTTSKFIQPTSTKSAFTSDGTQVVSSTQTVDFGSGEQTVSATTSVFEQIKTADSQKIEPSPTMTEMPREVTAETTREATPVLPDGWKPDTKDLLQEKTSAQTQKASETTTKQTMKPDPSSAIIPPGEATINVPPSDLPQQVETADVAMNGASSDDITDELGSLDGETGEEIQDQRPNTTVIDEKVVVGNGGQQKRENLSLVRLPVIPSGKRESAIMRLSNRIKVLEQNVSLSSRFLEELSRRYKKQSEDMMKMLNKTMAALNNMTVEAEVKNKIHEDEMTAMERRLENLTHIVHKLTQNFDTLNRQVTDRQMIWTTIEMVLIIFMLLFLHFRRKKVALPPEVKSLIESMPNKPATSLPQRRNSLSGPATPSKERTFGNLQSGGGLQRFSSETALDSDFPIVHPIGGSFKQGLEAVKKKKKKKHKNLDIKLSLPNVSGPARVENWSAQFSSHQSINSSNQSKETSPQPFNKSNLFLGTSHPAENRGNQSKEKGLHASCSMPQTQSGCFGSLLSGWSNSTATKQRSASLGTDISSTTFSTHIAGSFHPSVLEGTKDGLGTKNGTKGLAKKPPVSGGTSKVSPKLNAKNPKGSENEGSSKRLETTLEEKWIMKGHRRQKSLPKQHFSSVETVGNTSHDYCNPVGILGTVRHSDTSPFLNKISKKGEIKKSSSLLVSSESTFETAPASIYTFANGHSDSTCGTFDTGQARNYYPLEKSKSDLYIASKYGKNMYKSEYLSNGHTNGDDCNENACSVNQSATVSCSKAKNDRTNSEPWVIDNTDSVKSGQNGTWKNIIGYFK